MSAIFVLLFVGLVACQPHHGPDVGSVSCYQCGGPGPGGEHGFPNCLQHTRQCHHDEACMMSYGGHGPAHEHGPEVRCAPPHECHSHAVDDVSQACPAGGHQGPDDPTCKICCEDDACLSEGIAKLQAMLAAAAAKTVACPGHCDSQDIDVCLQSAHHCHEHQYCKVTTDAHGGHMQGKCEDAGHLQHCQDQLASGNCDHHHCVEGCCSDSQCVTSLYGGGSNGSVPSTDTTATPGDGGLSTLTCGDLQGLGCGVLDGICSKVHCPDVCDQCFSPIQTVPPGTQAPAQTGNPAVSDAIPTDAPATDAPQPTSVPPAGTTSPDADTSLPQSGPDTGMDKSTQNSGTTAPSCVDTIQNMKCADVEDVCSSPLLVSFCEKHCGLCCE